MKLYKNFALHTDITIIIITQCAAEEAAQRRRERAAEECAEWAAIKQLSKKKHKSLDAIKKRKKFASCRNQKPLAPKKS